MKRVPRGAFFLLAVWSRFCDNVEMKNEWLLEWRSEYSVGNDIIDQQHQGLFVIANEILRAHDADESTRGIMKLFKYTRIHFHDEEEIMAQRGYSGLEEHRQKHEELIERLGGIATVINHDKEAFSERVFELMLDWILTHIVEEDRKIGFT